MNNDLMCRWWITLLSLSAKVLSFSLIRAAAIILKVSCSNRAAKLGISIFTFDKIIVLSKTPHIARKSSAMWDLG